MYLMKISSSNRRDPVIAYAPGKKFLNLTANPLQSLCIAIDVNAVSIKLLTKKIDTDAEITNNIRLEKFFPDYPVDARTPREVNDMFVTHFRDFELNVEKEKPTFLNTGDTAQINFDNAVGVNVRLKKDAFELSVKGKVRFEFKFNIIEGA